MLLNILFFLIFLFIPVQVFAYLDPGTGSYIVQIIIAGFLGALFAIKLFWSNIKTFFLKIFSAKKNHDKPKKN